jgi:hypothetical protein
MLCAAANVPPIHVLVKHIVESDVLDMDGIADVCCLNRGALDAARAVRGRAGLVAKALRRALPRLCACIDERLPGLLEKLCAGGTDIDLVAFVALYRRLEGLHCSVASSAALSRDMHEAICEHPAIRFAPSWGSVSLRNPYVTLQFLLTCSDVTASVFPVHRNSATAMKYNYKAVAIYLLFSYVNRMMSLDSDIARSPRFRRVVRDKATDIMETLRYMRSKGGMKAHPHLRRLYELLSASFGHIAAYEARTHSRSLSIARSCRQNEHVGLGL